MGYILRKLIKSYILLILFKIITLNHSHIVNSYRTWAPSYAYNSYATFLLIKIKNDQHHTYPYHTYLHMIHMYGIDYVWLCMVMIL